MYHKEFTLPTSKLLLGSRTSFKPCLMWISFGTEPECLPDPYWSKYINMLFALLICVAVSLLSLLNYSILSLVVCLCFVWSTPEVWKQSNMRSNSLRATPGEVNSSAIFYFPKKRNTWEVETSWGTIYAFYGYMKSKVSSLEIEGKE